MVEFNQILHKTKLLLLLKKITFFGSGPYILFKIKAVRNELIVRLNYLNFYLERTKFSPEKYFSPKLFEYSIF